MTVTPIDSENVGTTHKTSIFPILVVSFMTILLALLSMMTGHRLSTLQAQFRNKASEAAIFDANAREQMQNALDSAKQALLEEKKGNDQLKKKITAVTKEMTALRTELAQSKKRIENLQSISEIVTSSIDPVPSPKSADETVSVSVMKE
jgi:flagellar motility protein MotE (MotC chaperone)